MISGDVFKTTKFKILIVIPIAILLFSIGVLYNNYSQTGEWFERSIELKGGTLVSVKLAQPVDVIELESQLIDKLGTLNVREIKGFSGNSLLIESGDIDAEDVLDELYNLGVDTTGYSIETIGPSLGESFWFQAQLGIIVAFIFMGIIVFVIFRTGVPSVAVIMAAVMDIIVTLGFMQVFHIDLSLAGLAALLMLIGYSVDTDILLTTRFLKGRGEYTEKFKSTLKTALTMSLTSIGALVSLLLFGISPVLGQIASVLLIGLIIDIINTWLMNAVTLTWYANKRGLV